MANQQLLDYIKRQIDEGVSKEDTKSTLLQNGWSDVDIDEAIKQIKVVPDVSEVRQKDPQDSDNEMGGNKWDTSYQSQSKKIIVIIFVMVVLVMIIGVVLYFTFSDPTETIQDNNSQKNSLIIDNDKTSQLPTQDLTGDPVTKEETGPINSVTKESTQNPLLPPIEELTKKIFDSYSGVDITDLHRDNHYRLLNCELKLRESHLSYEEYSSEQIKTCYMALYKDALFTRVAYEDLSDSTAQQLINEINNSTSVVKLELLVSVGNYLDEYYLNALLSALGSLFQTEDRVDTDSEISVRFDDNMYGKRKRLSTNFYKTLMRDYFTNSDVSIVDKVTYFKGIIAENDGDLIEYGMNFFEEVKEDVELTSGEVEMVDGVIQLYDKWVSDNTRKIQY